MKWDSWKLEPHEGLFWEREARKGWRSWRSGRRFRVQRGVCGDESCRGLAAAGQDGGAEDWGGDLDTGEGFVWVSPVRGCGARQGGPTTALALLIWGFPKPG